MYVNLVMCSGINDLSYSIKKLFYFIMNEMNEFIIQCNNHHCTSLQSYPVT